ncbi:conjugal transfer protein TraN, partial [Pseudomonas aeruginosa]|uniref:conjugal transfer protein TraN n=1 Tax=Pseudomonas aeruginosa TaxID=287 RepID=UPI003983CB51
MNTCAQYEKNPSCALSLKAVLTGQRRDSSCYAFEEIWDCGYDTSYDTIVNTGAQIECPGGARCMGSECFDSSNTKSGDFAYAVAMLQVAQFAEHDLDCGEMVPISTRPMIAGSSKARTWSARRRSEA